MKSNSSGLAIVADIGLLGHGCSGGFEFGSRPYARGRDNLAVAVTRQGGSAMQSPDLQEVLERYQETLHAVVRGDTEPTKRLWSRRDDVTLANPIGPPARGWADVEVVLDRAVWQLREGEPVQFERISEYATQDLGYVLWIERTRVKFGTADEIRPISLRVTTIFRREDEGWRIIHRHADPITTPRPIESIATEG
jgi:ketosteroid isomerase-like protein